MSIQPNDPDQIPRCACGARILTPPDMECPLCAMQARNDRSPEEQLLWEIFSNGEDA